MKTKTVRVKDVLISYASMSITTLLTHKVGDIEFVINHISGVSLDKDGKLDIMVDDHEIQSIKYLGVRIAGGNNITKFMTMHLDMGIDLYIELSKLPHVSRIKKTLPVKQLESVLALMGN
jgi:hypothetical protein